MLFTIISGIAIRSGVFNGIGTNLMMKLSNAPVEKSVSLLNWVLNSEFIFNGLAVIGLATGIYFRIKTLKH